MADHTFCRQLLGTVIADVRKVVSVEVRKNAWSYNYKDGKQAEFQINACKEESDGYYWHGTGCCSWIASAHGWMAYLHSRNYFCSNCGMLKVECQCKVTFSDKEEEEVIG